MTRDPLRTLLRLRAGVLDTAKRALAEAVAAEGHAIAAGHAARDAMRLEEAAAMSLDASDGAVEAFAAWMPHGRRRIEAALADCHARAADLVAARARLALASAGVESIAAVLDARAAALTATQSRKAQAEMDEVGRGRHRTASEAPD